MNGKWDDEAEQRSLGPRRSSGRLLGLFVLLAVVVLIVIALRTVTPQVDPAASPAVGQRFEQLQLEPLEGEGESLSLDALENQVALINFWGPWCPPCRLEFPELMELRSDLAKNKDFRFVSVTCDQNEAALVEQTKAYLKSEGYELPVHRDPTFQSRVALEELNGPDNFAYPTTVLLDRQGVIRSLWTGYHPGVGREMRQQIDKLLK